MENIIRITSEIRRKKRILFICAIVLGLIVSFFCIGKYIRNSQSISFDITSFQQKEGFNYLIEDNSLKISPVDYNNTSTELCTESCYTILSKGTYSYCIAYESDADMKAYILAGDSLYEEFILPAGSHIEHLTFTLNQPVIDARVRIHYGGYGNVCVNGLFIESESPIVSDWLFVMVCMWIVILSTALLVNSYFENKLTKGHFREICFVLLISLISIPYLILTSNGIFWGIDTNAHNIRIEFIKDALLQGQFPVVIAPSMCNGYGSIEPIVYPSLFLYPFAILRILKVSPVMVYKFAHIIINILMCASCYICSKKITRSCKAAALSLVAFAFSKYHLMTIGHFDWTYGMGISIVFFFVVLIGLYEIFIGNKLVWPYLSIGMWGIFNSHIMTTVFAAVVAGLFALFYLKKAIIEDRIKQFIYAVAASVAICIYRIYTFLDAMLNNRLNTSSLNMNMFSADAYSMKGLVTSPITYIMLVTLLLSIGYFMLTAKHYSNGNKLTAVCMIITSVCLVFSTTYIPWKKVFSNKILAEIFGFIQYPDRLFQVAIPLCCITLGVIYRNMLRRNDKKAKALTIATFVAVAVSSIWSYSSEIKEIKKLDKVFVGKVVGDVLSFPGMTDYVPDGESYDSYSGRSLYYSGDSIEITEGSYEKKGTNISAEINCSADNSYIDFPIFGYKGYVCKDTNDNYLKTGIGENHRLRVFFDSSSKPVYIRIRYKIPSMYYVLLIVSYMSLFALITYNEAFLARTKKKLRYYEFLKSFDYKVL